jgi:hypothetical protein
MLLGHFTAGRKEKIPAKKKNKKRKGLDKKKKVGRNL